MYTASDFSRWSQQQCRIRIVPGNTATTDDRQSAETSKWEGDNSEVLVRIGEDDGFCLRTGGPNVGIAAGRDGVSSYENHPF